MNYFKYLTAAFSIAAMVGCSDDNFVDNNNYEVLEDGGSVTVRINLPSTSAKTRITGDGAIGDGGLDNGKANEYEVDNASIYLFDASQNIVTNHTLTGEALGFGTENTPDYVTSKSTVISLDKGLTTPKYVLALINVPSEVTDLLTAPKTFADIQTAVKGTNAIEKGLFFMSNSTFDNTGAPSSVFRSLAEGVQSLQEIDPSSLSKTAGAAATKATNIYVERASVKVDLDFFNGKTALENATFTKGTNNLPTLTFTATGNTLAINGWTLTVTNNSYYPVKMIDQTTWNDWRSDKVYQMANHISEAKWFRSYWAIDPDYVDGPIAVEENANGRFKNFTYATYRAAADKEAGSDAPQYCLENTFTAANQNQNQTTAVLITGIYQLNGQDVQDIYSLSGMIYNATDLAKELATVFELNGYKKSTDGVLSNLTAADITVAPGNKIYKDLILFADVANSSLYKGEKEIVAKGAESATNYAAMTAALAGEIGSAGLAYYEGGRCYYSIPIRHFNDAEVALYQYGTEDTTKDYKEFEGAEGGRSSVNSKDQEGRYGVVRNHWYSVNVSSIAQIGRPAPVDPTDPINPDPNFPDPQDPTDPSNPTPDDVENLYLQAQINILPWAKRSQDADL